MNASHREFKDFLLDIMSCSKKAQSFISDLSFNDFENDEKTVFAVMKALEIIGEATKKIPSDIKQKYPKIPWRQMAGIRDKIVHGYFGLDLEILFDVVKTHLPLLDKETTSLIKDLNLEGDLK